MAASPETGDGRDVPLWEALNGISQTLETVIDRRLAEHGLSSADHTVLRALAQAPDGMLRPRDLGRSIRWDPSRLSHHLARMERRRLVERFHCPTDARGTLVRCTDQGVIALAVAGPAYEEAVRQYFLDRLSPHERDELGQMLDRLGEQTPWEDEHPGISKLHP